MTTDGPSPSCGASLLDFDDGVDGRAMGHGREQSSSMLGTGEGVFLGGRARGAGEGGVFLGASCAPGMSGSCIGDLGSKRANVLSGKPE